MRKNAVFSRIDHSRSPKNQFPSADRSNDRFCPFVTLGQKWPLISKEFMPFFPESQNVYFGVSVSKVGQKCPNVKCSIFPHIHTIWRVLTSWRLYSIMGPWRSIRVLPQRKRKKIVIFSFFENPYFFNQTPKDSFQVGGPVGRIQGN